MSDHRDSILINSYITQTFNRIDERANAASRSTVIRPSLMPDIRQSSWLVPFENIDESDKEERNWLKYLLL